MIKFTLSLQNFICCINAEEFIAGKYAKNVARIKIAAKAASVVINARGGKFRQAKFSLDILVKFNQNQTSFGDLSASRRPKT